MLRRLLAFLFTHDWETRPPNIYSGEPWAVLECKHCGAIEEYPMLDQAAFTAIYRMRGCPGETTKATTGGSGG